MDFTFQLSKAFGVLPFRILEENADDVVLLINYLSMTEENKQADTGADVAQKPAGKDERIKVNDKTATGGWW